MYDSQIAPWLAPRLIPNRWIHCIISTLRAHLILFATFSEEGTKQGLKLKIISFLFLRWSVKGIAQTNFIFIFIFSWSYICWTLAEIWDIFGINIENITFIKYILKPYMLIIILFMNILIQDQIVLIFGFEF